MFKNVNKTDDFIPNIILMRNNLHYIYFLLNFRQSHDFFHKHGVEIINLSLSHYSSVVASVVEEVTML
jgi:hypothetical protein